MGETAKATTVPPSGKPPTSQKTSGGEQKEKKPRAPRQNYGFAPGAKIVVSQEEKKYRGQRLEWYEALKAANGKTVEQFFEATKGRKDPARGWLRFFVQDGACSLSAPPATEAKS